MHRRFPDEDYSIFPREIDQKKLKANTCIYCPVMKFNTAITVACYNCDVGFNGACQRLNQKIVEEPRILDEIYRPVPELVPTKTWKKALIFKRKLISMDYVTKVNPATTYFVTGKYKLTIRFIPKYEKYPTRFKGVKFWDKELRKIMDFDDLVSLKQTGDLIYSVARNKKYLDTLRLAEKLND